MFLRLLSPTIGRRALHRCPAARTTMSSFATSSNAPPPTPSFANSRLTPQALSEYYEAQFDSKGNE